MLQALLASSLAADGKFSRAWTAAKRARELGENLEHYFPPNTLKRLEELSRVSSPEFERGVKALNAGDFFKAREWLRAAVEKTPGEVACAALVGAGDPAQQGEDGLARETCRGDRSFVRAFPG